MGRDFQLSDEPYKRYLEDVVGVQFEYPASLPMPVQHTCSWWSTEVDGWQGGASNSAKTVRITQRRSYQEGFFPLTDTDIPPEEPLRYDHPDVVRSSSNTYLGLAGLSSWQEYYKFRGINQSSPAALLLTFPLTIYYGIVRYGSVPLTVARMMNRPMRIHVVGIEKELNFLDLFREVGFLLPKEIRVSDGSQPSQKHPG